MASAASDPPKPRNPRDVSLKMFQQIGPAMLNLLIETHGVEEEEAQDTVDRWQRTFMQHVDYALMAPDKPPEEGDAADKEEDETPSEFTTLEAQLEDACEQNLRMTVAMRKSFHRHLSAYMKETQKKEMEILTSATYHANIPPHVKSAMEMAKSGAGAGPVIITNPNSIVSKGREEAKECRESARNVAGALETLERLADLDMEEQDLDRLIGELEEELGTLEG